jgi:hypothetical protein
MTKDRRYVQKCLGPALDLGRGSISGQEAIRRVFEWFDTGEAQSIAHTARPVGRMTRVKFCHIDKVGAARRMRTGLQFPYTFEELVAEIGNCMLSAQLGLEPEFDQSAAYVEGWLKALKEDNRAIFRAASDAQKAMDYIMARAAQVYQMAAE